MIERIVIKNYRMFEDFELEPNTGSNIVVGDNDAGKSTLLEAISLAMTGRVNGRWAQEELNPYWFNKGQVDAYFASLGTEEPLSPPEILIELYLSDQDDLQALRGVYNSRQEAVPGVKVYIAPSKEYAAEFADYMADEECPHILPTEWYAVEWTQFSDDKLTQRPKNLRLSVIDSKTVRASSGVDYHTREMLKSFIEPKERAQVAVAHRKSRFTISAETLKPVNARIADEGESLHEKVVGLHMDQSSNASWENSIVPQVAEIPFSMAGQGQQAAIKVALAMSRSAGKTQFALIEEPENHLSHTGLTKLVKRIESLAGDRQVFIATHSSYVLNRLGLDKLVLLHKGKPAKFESLPADTVKYFKKLSGYDTLRLVLAEQVVLVEGPSDEMVFERAFHDRHGVLPMERGVDVISMGGVSLMRRLQLCAALDRRVAGIRDNDGKDPAHWSGKVDSWISAGSRELFIGDPADGSTLEPQFIKVNDASALKSALDLDADADLADWMKSNKSEWALRLDESDAALNYPGYINDAVEFVS